MTIWFVAAALVLLVELFAGTVYLMVISGALFGAGLAAWLSGSVSAAVVTAAALAALGIWAVNRHVRRHPKPVQEDDLDIGQTVYILRRLHGDRYEVSYRGTHWQAQALNAASASDAQTAVITGKQGNLLLVHLH